MPDPPTTGLAREAMLASIRSITGEPQPPASIEAEWAVLPRHFLEETGLSQEDRVNLLVERLRDYDAHVYRIPAESVAQTVAAILQAARLGTVLVPAGIPPEWLPHPNACTEDRNFTPHELDRFQAVLTASALAIAETGTVILQNAPGQGRRAATLVPDIHLCVVREADVVHTVPEAIRRLQANADLPTTLISGPSATADIEMTRIKGVHGPRFLHVLLVQ